MAVFVDKLIKLITLSTQKAFYVDDFGKKASPTQKEILSCWLSAEDRLLRDGAEGGGVLLRKAAGRRVGTEGAAGESQQGYTGLEIGAGKTGML